jgi:NADH-quinone oxidoreductase subunit J
MPLFELIFILVAALTLGAAFLVVTSKNLIHSALWLVVALFGVAIVFALLNAGFLAVVQVVIYIGAIAILMIFTIMLTRFITQSTGPRFNTNWIWALIISFLMFGGLIWIFNSWPGINTQLPPLPADFDPIRQLGIALVSPNAYVLPFELASVLLVAALIGAIIVAWERT